ncbi:MAG: hypothetical protein HYZ63_02960 [Candidatus Andersenbacteria bacterium]|nr:hypothetical protein [Candidatus Andersenbacteria bacterium]
MTKSMKSILSKNLVAIIGIAVIILLVILNKEGTSLRPAEVPDNFTSYINTEIGVSFWYPKAWGKVEVTDAPTMVTLTFTKGQVTFQLNKIGELGRGGTPADDLIKYTGNYSKEYPSTETIYKNGNKVSIWTNYDPCWKAVPREGCLFITLLPAAASAPLKKENYEPGIGVYLTDNSSESVEDFTAMMKSFEPIPVVQEEKTTYSNDLLGFSIEVPHDWEIVERTGVEVGVGRYVTFTSPETKKDAIENNKACRGQKSTVLCAPELPGIDVIFQEREEDEKVETKIVAAGQYKWQRNKYFGSFYGEPYYVIQFPNGKYYAFSVYNTALEEMLLEKLKTFKLL